MLIYQEEKRKIFSEIGWTDFIFGWSVFGSKKPLPDYLKSMPHRPVLYRGRLVDETILEELNELEVMLEKKAKEHRMFQVKGFFPWTKKKNRLKKMELEKEYQKYYDFVVNKVEDYHLNIKVLFIDEYNEQLEKVGPKRSIQLRIEEKNRSMFSTTTETKANNIKPKKYH